MITAGILIICSLAFVKRRWVWLKEFSTNNGDEVMGRIGLPVSHKQPWHALTVFVQTVFRLPFWFIGTGTSPYHGSGVPIPRIPAICAVLFVIAAAAAAFAVLPVPIMLIFIGPWLVYLFCPVPDQLMEYRNYSSTAGFALLGTYMLDSFSYGWFALVPMMAWTAILANNWSGWIEMWTAAANHSSGCKSVALGNLGAFYKSIGEEWKAEMTLKDALRWNPNHGPALNNIASMSADKAAKLHFQAEEWRQKGNLAEAARCDAGVAPLLDEAIIAMRRGAERCPRYADNWRDLGILYEQRSALSDSAFCYMQAWTLNPDPGVANRLGLIQVVKKEWDTAIRWFDEALGLAPGHEAYIWNKATVFKLSGDSDGADRVASAFQGRPVKLTSDMIKPDYVG